MLTNAHIHRLDRRTLGSAVKHLTRRDPALRAVVRRHGPPPLWSRRPGVGTLVQIILEQQVSLASARAVYRRLEQTLGHVTCEKIAQCGPTGLRRLGFTRQKAAYCCGLGESIAAGTLNLRRVARASVEAGRAELMRVPGVGPWTADIYMLMVLRRPDVWPTGDIALLTALQHLRRLPRRPSVEHAAEHARRWMPWRAVAARILWHGYLAGSLKTTVVR
jgi:DNA-3-methyladenine glycosylase II